MRNVPTNPQRGSNPLPPDQGTGLGKPLKLIKFDTGTDPKQAATATQKFAQDDKVLAIIGPFSSGEAAVTFPIGERLGIVELQAGDGLGHLAELAGTIVDQRHGERQTELHARHCADRHHARSR